MTITNLAYIQSMFKPISKKTISSLPSAVLTSTSRTINPAFIDTPHTSICRRLS